MPDDYSVSTRHCQIGMVFIPIRVLNKLATSRCICGYNGRRNRDISMGIESICVLGGSGFVGSHLTAKLATRYSRVVVLTRHRERHRHLLVMPTVELVEADIHVPATLSKQFQGIDAVINLVGILNEVK